MTTTPQAALLSESEIVACIAKAGCCHKCRKAV